MKHIIQVVLLLLSGISVAQEVSSHKLSACDSDSFPDFVRRRIVSKSAQNDTLTLLIGFSGNCCLETKPEVRSSNDTLFLTIENSSDSYCSCDCCFEIELKVSKMTDTNFVLMWGEYEVKTQSKYPKMPHEYEFDEDTPRNQLNAEGERIGLWTEITIAGRKLEMYYDPNPKGKAQRLWSMIYDPTGELVSVRFAIGSTGDVHIIEADVYWRYFKK